MSDIISRNERFDKRNKKGKKKKRKILLAILISIIIVFTLIIGAGLVVANMFLNKADRVELDHKNLGVTSKEELKVYDDHEKIRNVALFGVDSADGVGRSDAIMIGTVDPVHNKLKITSIMRDSYVNIDGYGYDKINHAYAYGGPELAIKTINQTFGLNIKEFVAVDFGSLPQIIDLLGGVDIEIHDYELENLNMYIRDFNRRQGTSSPEVPYSGVNTLDGVQALAYTRIRYAGDGDFERTERQRKLINSFFNKALSVSPGEYLDIINTVLPYVRTNIKVSDMISFAGKIAGMGDGKLVQDRFPKDEDSTSEMINDVFYFKFDESVTKQKMMDYIFDDKQ